MDINKSRRWSELLTLFVVAPFLLISSLPIPVIILLVLAMVGYCLRIMYREGILRKESLLEVNWTQNSKMFLLRFGIFAAISTAMVAVLLPEKLFDVVLNNPLLWIAISFFYAIFSVYPQEMIYRQFFFARYQDLFPNVPVAIAINGVLFSFAHLVFNNPLVFALTFAGGLLFAYTYCSKKSLMLTSIEHALYGVWLFTLGIGDMLAFPGP